MVAVGKLALVVLFEEVHGIDPEELPLPRADQPASARDLGANDAHDLLRLAAAVGREQDEVTGGRPGQAHDGFHLLGPEVARAMVTSNPARILSNEHLVPESVRALAAEHMDGSRDHGHALWTLLTLELFLRRQGW